jgi:hypothetical protein
MPFDEFEFRRVMRSNLSLVECECEHVFGMLRDLSEGDIRIPPLLAIHEALANIVATMKANLVRLS